MAVFPLREVMEGVPEEHRAGMVRFVRRLPWRVRELWKRAIVRGRLCFFGWEEESDGEGVGGVEELW